MKKRLLSMMLLLVMTFSLCACGNGKGTGNAQRGGDSSTSDNGGKTLTVAVSSAPITANPLNINDPPSHITGYCLYDSIMRPSIVEEDGEMYADASKPDYCIADSYEVSDDQLTYTFHIREGITFANGDPITTDAIEEVSKNLEGTFLYSEAAKIDSYKTIDDSHFSFTLKEPNKDFLSCMCTFKIYNPAQIPEGEDTSWLDTNSAGSGAYVLDSWDPSSEIVLKANENYYAGKPYYAEIIIKYIPETSNHTLLLQTGDIDLSMSVPTKDIDTLKDDPNVKVSEMASNRIAYFTMNSSMAPFDNEKVRQAICYAIPYDSLINDVMEGHATSMISCSPIALDDTIEAQQYSYNLDKAKELLKEAGYPDGFEFDFTLCSGYTDYEGAATLIQSELAKIGVKMNINTVEYSAFMEELDANKCAAFINSWTPFVPSNIYHINSLFTSKATFNKYTKLNDSKIDELMSDINIVDDATASDKIAEAQKLINNDACWGYLYQYNNLIVTNSKIQGPVLASDNVPRLALLSE